MADELSYSIRVNQKLAFARILIDTAEDKTGDDTVPGKQAMLAFLDSAIAQLHDALGIFLLEIAAHTQASIDVDCYTIAIILEQLQQQGVDNPLSREIGQRLKKENWVSSLIQANADSQWLIKSSLNENKIKVDNGSSTKPLAPGTIPVVNIDKSPAIDPFQQVKQWQQELQSLIELHRNLIVED